MLSIVRSVRSGACSTVMRSRRRWISLLCARSHSGSTSAEESLPAMRKIAAVTPRSKFTLTGVIVSAMPAYSLAKRVASVASFVVSMRTASTSSTATGPSRAERRPSAVHVVWK
jgi:hypothetical protein